MTRKSITDWAELKGLYKGAISTYRDQRDVAIQVLEDVLELYNRLTMYVLKDWVGDIEYIDNDSSEEEMEHLDNSPPITLMALGGEYNSEEATKRPATFVCHHHLDPEQEPRSWISKRISSYKECQVQIEPQEDFCICVT